MKNTKEVILKTALKLFNSDGLSQVALRTIANEMGISQGNLNYHYKKRDEIIAALYFQLVDIMDVNMLKSQSETVGLKTVLDLSAVIMESFFEYRFFMLDFVQIMRESDKIKTHYFQLSQKREEQFLLLFQFFVANEILREEVLPNEYLYLYKRFQILGDFWISSAAVTNDKLSKKIITEYSHIINQAIFPYLTEKGKQEYCKVLGC